MAGLSKVSAVRCFGGSQCRYKHESKALGCEMVFSVFLPPAAAGGKKVPVLVYLSGLTCTDENFSSKSGAQRAAAAAGIALLIPDTSPRGLGVEGEDEAYDFGTGAGFYLNATQPAWKGYRMEVRSPCTRPPPRQRDRARPRVVATRPTSPPAPNANRTTRLRGPTARAAAAPGPRGSARARAWT